MGEEEKKVAPAPAGEDADDARVISAIGYLGILFLIPLLAKPNSKFAQYHARQGIALFIFGIAVGIVSAIPVLGWVVGAVGWVLSLILLIMGFSNALAGKTQPLPVIGKYAEKV